jgi:hypothetical protein
VVGNVSFMLKSVLYCSWGDSQSLRFSFRGHQFSLNFNFLLRCFYRFYIVHRIFVVLFSINSQELFEVAATEFTAGTAALYHIVSPSAEHPWSVLNSFTRS